MKLVGKLLAVYSVFMLAALGIMVLLWNNMKTMTVDVATYNTEELEIYKKIWNNLNSSVDATHDTMLKYIIIFWSVILVLGIILILLVYGFLIKPVKEMESFASEIAKGNMDVALPIHRGNMFGTFTESFDLMREQLKISKERELEAEKAKREMVAELSHDLKTPVATIRATCEVLDMKYRKEIEKAEKTGAKEDIEGLQGYLEKIGYIYSKADMINELVGNVFRATLDDIQEIKIEPTENDSTIIETYFRSLKEYGNIILDNSIPKCLVYLDKLRMEQVIDNIVGNSYKYAGTDIHVSFSETEMVSDKKGKNDRFLKVTVRDSGPGVSEEELPLLTEKFQRGSNSADKPGYGLGMYLASHYMEKQGGGMEYYNDNGFVTELLVRKV
jgi:signal transduction histidine kinase